MARNFRTDVEKVIEEATVDIISGSSYTYQSASFLIADSGSVTQFHSPILIPVASASAMPNPQHGTGSLYVKYTDDKIYFKNSHGTEYNLTDTGGGGGGDLGEITGSNLLIDGSTSGSINFVNDGVIYIKDNDATALQIQEATNAYMTFDTTNSSEKVIISKDVQLVSTDAGAGTAPILDFFRDSSSPDESDLMGRIRFTGKDDAGNTTLYASITAEINDETNSGGEEDGVLAFNIIKNASQKSALELKNNEAVFNNNGQDIDFRIETDDVSGFVFIDGNNNSMSIGSGSLAVGSGFPTPQATLEITNKASSAPYNVPLLQLNSNDTNQHALDINAANINTAVIGVTADALTTAAVMAVSADALTTGGILNLASDSADTNERSLVKVHNDNTAATTTHLLHLLNDSQPDAHGESTALIESDRIGYGLELRYTGNNAGVSQMMIFSRTDTTGEGDDDQIGIIGFNAANDNNDMHIFAYIEGTASDVTDGDEGGLLQFFIASGGTGGTSQARELFTIGGEDVANTVVPAVVVNEAGINCDFRVESDAEDEAIFLDASANELHINKGETDFTTHIHGANDEVIRVTGAGVIFNEDGHATNDFRVESDNNDFMLLVNAGDDTIAAGGNDPINHKDGFAVFNDFNGTTFENKLADGQFGSGEVLRYSPGADDTLTAGQIYFLNTNGRWVTARANAAANGASQMLGIGLGGSARTVGCLIRGFIRIPSTEILNVPGSGAVDGLPVYIGLSSGHLDFTAPSSQNQFVRIVGYAIDDDSGDVLIYFNPDSTFVEIA